MAKAGKAFKKHMRKRYETFKEGKMHSRKRRTGPVVTSQKQFQAIALSEARKKGLKGAPRPKYMRGSGILTGIDMFKKVGGLV